MPAIWQIICLTLIAGLRGGNANCQGKVIVPNGEQRLFDCLDAIRSYSISLPNGRRPVTIKVTFPVITLLDYNDAENTIEVQMSVRYMWEDQAFKWEPGKFEGLKYIVMPAYRIWTPTPFITLNRNKNRQFMEMMKARIWYNGTIEWFLFLHTTTICITDFTDFPYDTQRCGLKFIQHPYTRSDVNISVDFNSYVDVQSASWNKRQSYLMRQYYTTHQPDGTVEERLSFSFHFVLDRKTIFFNYLIVCPSICVLIFILLLFMVPIQTNQRFVMALFLFMSTISLYLSTQHMLPPGTGKVPLIVRYITLAFILLLIAFIISIVTYYIYHHDRKELPSILKQIFLNPILRKLANVSPPLFTRQSSTDDLSTDKQGSPAHASKVSSSGENFDRTLDDVQKYLYSLVVEKDSNLKNSTFEVLVASEWKQMAVVIERICFIVFSILSVIITNTMFSSRFNIPKKRDWLMWIQY